MDPLTILNVIKDLFGAASKYWKPILIVLVLIASFFAVKHQLDSIRAAGYHQGYSDASDKYIAAATALRDAEQKAKDQALADHERQLQIVDAARNAAEQKAAQMAAARDTFQSKLEELQRNANNQYAVAPNPQPAGGATSGPPVGPVEYNPHLTAVYVGLYNLGIQASNPDGSVPSIAEVATASRVDWGSGAIDLSKPTEMTLDDVLYVNGHNMRIAQQCINERSIMDDYIQSLIKAGVVE